MTPEEYKKQKRLDIICTIIYWGIIIGIPILLIILTLAVNYWIAVSDLPDWFKFYLLQRG